MDISKNIKRVMMVFLICFMSLIGYITYFEIQVGPKDVLSPYNRRLWAQRNEVLRGTIYDRNMTPLTESTRISSDSQKRTYLQGELFSNVIGYEDTKYGLTGLERKYDTYLMGAADQSLLDIIKNKGQKKERVGDGVVLTIDANVQKTAYDLLGDHRGAVVAVNPSNGEILALVSKPTYDPNNLKDVMTKLNEGVVAEKSKDKTASRDLMTYYYQRRLINRATAGLYPPGSTFKTVTLSCALENMPGVMNRTFNDTGKLYFNSKDSLSDFDGEAFGSINLRNAYIKSSNVVFGTLGMELGNDKLRTQAEKFFFNKDLPNVGLTVENSKFPTLKAYEKGNLAQTAIGQGTVLETPLEMAMIASTVANGGVMMQPTVIKGIVKESKESNVSSMKTFSPVSLGTVIQKSTADTIKDFMKGVVQEGTGRAAQIPNVSVAGKTGTSEHSDSMENDIAAFYGGTRNPKPDSNSIFIGFAPSDNAKVAVGVVVEEGGQGGIIAAQIAKGVMAAALGVK